MSESKIYVLRDPIDVIGETVTELTFRPPTGRDIIKAGNPFDFLSGDIKIDDTKAAAMIGVLASIPQSSVASLSLTDWVGCILVLQGFLEPPGEIRSSTAISSVPASGATTSPTSST